MTILRAFRGQGAAAVSTYLRGVSIVALLAGGGTAGARSLNSSSSISLTNAASAAQLAAGIQAAAAAQQSSQSLARAAAALQAARAAQQSAKSLASTLKGGVPDGITTNGLMPADGIAGDPTLWQGALAPTQTVANGRTLVDIQQTQQKAILNWKTFNVGRNTTLTFDQQASDWTVLNRVSDPSASPSTILGQISAKGGVYIINQNGIIFGGGSQINVHALVASDLDVGTLGQTRFDRDQFFLGTGIANGTLAVKSFSIGGEDKQTKAIGGGVVVQAGATIQIDDPGPDKPGGFAYLFGSNVANYGEISVPNGEAALISARAIFLTPNSDAAASFPSAVLPAKVTFRGTGFQLSPYANSYNFAGTPSGPYLSGTGSVANNGLIETRSGIVEMAGDRVSIGAQGVISADTSISLPSMVLLHAATSVDLSGTISMLPSDTGATLPQSSSAGSNVQSFMPAYVEATAQGQVTVESSGLVSAPAASISINVADLTGSQGSSRTLFGDVSVNASLSGPQRVLLAPGATIDVAGLQNVELPASYNFISFTPTNEFADMPLQRSGALYGQPLWIDIRASGTRSDGTTWLGTPLANANDVVNAVGRSIFQLMTAGGNVSLTTPQLNAAGQEVVLQSGSVINTAGGSIRYLPGTVPVTILLGSDGRRYSMQNASPDMTYVGIAGVFTSAHSHWGDTYKQIWNTNTTMQVSGYTDGQGAGGVAVSTVNPVLAGTLLFGSVAGERQIASGSLPSQGYLTLTTPSTVVIGANATSLPADFDSRYNQNIYSANGTLIGKGTALLPPNPTNATDLVSSDNFASTSAYQTFLSADELSGYGLSALSITSNDLVVTKGSTLRLAAGGQLSVTTGGAIDVAGTVQAAGGKVNLKTDGYVVGTSSPLKNLFKPSVTLSGAAMPANVFVSGVLDVSGQWTNDTGRFGNDASGPGYINGGTITISTNKNSSNGLDTTGSILLASGSLLDVSSGGYISAKGTPKTVSSGLMAGAAGSISLKVYQGANFDPNAVGAPVPPTSGSTAVLQLDGAMRGYGFADSGTLTLAAAGTITIGNTSQPDSASGILIGGRLATLPVSLFANNGFGAFVIQSAPSGWAPNAQVVLPGTIVVAAGTSLKLQKQSLSSLADYSAVATGTKIAAIAPVVTVPDGQRTPVNLTLKSDNILLDAGATIQTDPGAVITIAGTPAQQGTSGETSQRAANVLLRGSIIDHSGTVSVNAALTWLDQNALIDLSGILQTNALFGSRGGPAVSGTVLAGGNLIVEAADPSVKGTNPNLSGTALVAMTGAKVDVSGAAGTLQVANSGSTRPSTFTLMSSWSDAGSVSIDVGAFAWGGTFVARAIDPRAQGGTLMLGGGAISLRQDSTAVTAALSNVGQASLANLGTLSQSLLTQLTAAAGHSVSIVAAADSSRLGAFDNVFLYSGTSAGGPGRIFTDLSGSTYNIVAPSLSELVVDGTLDLHIASRLEIAASSIRSVTPGSATPQSSVTLAAPYVLLTGGFPNGNGTTSAGASTFDVKNAQTIDIEGAAFNGFSSVRLSSSGDIRLSTPKVADGLISGLPQALQDTTTYRGFLDSSGDITLDAQRIYPVSSVDFFIRTPKSVTFSASAGSNLEIPLSAGGSISVYAASIEQGGNLFAPLGKITLGDDGTAARNTGGVVTGKIDLVPGSLTSVTLADTLVPYGETADGTNWYYNASLYPLQARNADGSAVVEPNGTSPVLPSKGLVLDSANVTVASGAKIDLRGGGDLQAMEFVSGKGGSRDVLATTPSGQTVYALLPSRNDGVAAFDIHFTTARSLDGGKTITAADAYPLAGKQIYIDGGNGIPAGTYTLYPGHYATLPGALRVVDYGSNVGKNLASGTTLPDGTVLTTGYYTSSTQPGTRSAGQELFAVQSGAVWKQYSEYTLSSANSYFVAKAAHDGVLAPRLPIDAGRLAAVASQSLDLAGTIAAQAAPGGRGGELDISASKLVVSQTNPIGVEPTYASSDGWVWLSVDQLNTLGLESMLLGGLRTDTASGDTLITPTAGQVTIDTRGAALTAPELVLAAQPANSLVQTVNVAGLGDVKVTLPAGGGGVTIASGSVIETTGAIQSGFGRHYVFAPSTPVTAQQLATALGGTLNGTQISNADLTRLPLTLPDGRAVGPSQLAALAIGQGALFVASNDSSLTVTGPAANRPDLTISFAPVAAAGGAAVTGTVNLPFAGQVLIEAGSRISTQNLSLQATSNTNAVVLNASTTAHPAAPPAVLDAKQINITARSIGFESNLSPTRTESLLLSQTNFGQLAGAQSLTLKALSGPVTFYGDVAFTPGGAMQNLTLDARTIAGTGGDVRLAIGGTATLVSSSSASEAAITSTSGTFELDAGKIVLGGGTQTIAGFSNVNLTAAKQLNIAGPGSLALGATGQAAAVDININTPLVQVSGQTGAATGAQFALTTNGTVTFTRPGDPRALVSRPDDSSDLGGNLAVTAASIRLGEVDANGQPVLAGGIIQAQAGNITLHATSGDVTLNPGAYIAAGGYEKTFIDVTTYAPGGKVVLQSDAGNVNMRQNSVVDVGQPVGGLGHGGEIDVTARSGNAVVAGALMGSGGTGLGGTFKLDILGAADLDTLASTLGAGGLNGSVDIHTRTGNLVLSAGSTLKANSVVLTADDQRWNGTDGYNGQVIISGKIDASGSATDTIDGSGQAGGQASLYGYNAVVLTAGANIDASTAHSNERGGDVVLGIGTNAAGYIDLRGGGINVSGPKGGVGGTIHLRAPIIMGNALGQGDVRIAALNSSMTGMRAVTVEPYVTLSSDGSIGLNGSWYHWNGIIDPANDPFLYNLIASYVQGQTIYGFAGTFARLTPLAQQLGAGMVTVQPGLELINNNKSVNNGDITIASNWNLASGTAYDLKTSGGVTYFDYNSSSVKFDYRLSPYVYGANVGALFGVSSPGALTLRTSGNINVNASISDGFFQFSNYLDPTYVSQVATYLANLASSGQVRGMDGSLSGTGQNVYLYLLNGFNPQSKVPIAPYNQAANGISPGSDALAAADLFPHSLLTCQTYCGNGWGTKVSVVDPGSWTYRFTAGADVASANPIAMQSLATVVSGSVIIDHHTTYNQPKSQSGAGSSVNLATMVRTGTGDISIAAARDVVLNDTTAPGTIYSAGVNTARLADPQYQLGGTTVSAQNPDGFFEPQVLAYNGNVRVANTTLYGPPTAAAFPENGGNVDIVAQRDFIGFNTTTTSGNQTSFQYFAPWLLAQAELTPVPVNTGTRLMGAGVFAPTGTSIASQSAWWIQYGSFQQGVLSAGGDVTLTVGRDMVDVSVSLPTTGRVSGGLSTASTPQTHVYGSGNLSVQVGRNLLGGALYEGSGHASVVVRGSVGQAGNLVASNGSSVNYPLLAVDSGQIALAATGSVTTAGVINPAAIHSQSGSYGDPLGRSAAVFMDTYGRNSAASILAVGGDLTIGVAPIGVFYGGRDLAYPSSFEAVALSGDIKTTGMTSVQNSGIMLSGSTSGSFQLLAQGSIDLTGGYTPTSGLNRPTFSAGPSLLDTAFNPFRPNNGFGDRLSSEVLAHQDDTEVAHIYAMTGDIVGVGTVKSSISNNQVSISDIQRVEINSPAEVHAGRDIVDLNLIVQNISESDVSKVDAGRDIYYTGFNLAGGLQVAGPGFFVVQAGRDLGPLLPAVHDNASEAVMQQGITAVGNASFTPVGNRYVVQASSGMYDPLLLGPTGQTPKQRNPLLAQSGADLIVQFGVANGINYDGFWKLDPLTNQPVYYPGVIDAYLNPARGSIDPIVSGDYSALSVQLKQFLAANPGTTQTAVLGTYQAASTTPAAHNYTSELQSFLARIGHPAADASSAWTTFQGLSKDLQHAFADQIFYAELKAVGQAQTNSSGNYQRGYQAINTLFPAGLGYTANALGGGSNGANQLIATGDLDMLHATIQTQQGGNVSIMGPGGNIRVGSLATEPNQLLKLNDLGIMTLAGGSIDTFTDQSVRVNSSRVFTEQGGDILMWSSNGDLDAGRGAKTTLSLPPIQVHFDQDDYASTDLGGLVTGAGIAVLQTSSAATTSNLYLLAPRGTVDAGTAGIRVSGNLIVAAVQVVNAFNVKVGGSTTGVQITSVPNVGALSAASNTAGAAAKSAETPTASGGGDRASVFIVEVVGYGGGDGSSEATPSGASTNSGESANPEENTKRQGQ
ncbi:filamentous hemagglutinin family protein [Bradyrhizobium sp. CIAT3101]|uniref:filamentous haemagglutinin family protein n=1 Tax=Bradyrhizobium sp. CIAT3101 TaxID=439387 RepID=UPI0024B170D2|nr:filamentous haemagglutinin family protein [Bradyrhizobium sp. CIAT3101]WFU84465.1 filamentous hemagglutinin family protein [Bradyrhizobium sp. CIAT3101]